MLAGFRKETAPARGTHPSIVENAASTNHQTAPAPIVVKSESLSDLGRMLADSGRSAFWPQIRKEFEDALFDATPMQIG